MSNDNTTIESEMFLIIYLLGFIINVWNKLMQVNINREEYYLTNL